MGGLLPAAEPAALRHLGCSDPREGTRGPKRDERLPGGGPFAVDSGMGGTGELRSLEPPWPRYADGNLHMASLGREEHLGPGLVGLDLALAGMPRG